MVDTETKTTKLSTILQFFAIGLPLAYLTGYLYQQGYLSTYGFSSDAFLQAPEYYLVNFFIAVSMLLIWGLEKIFSHWQPFLLFFVMLFIVAVVAANFEDKVSGFNNRMKLKVKESFKKPPFLKFFLPVIFATMMTSMIYLIFVLVGTAVIACFSGFYIGKNVAQDEIKEFSCGVNARCQSLFVNGESKGIGYVIAMSDKFIAFRTANETVMFPNENIVLKGNIAVDK
ncbi:hypothetical protein [Rheinheimera mangrovi]|uniref:hypothetical protein n=1 Tax=Rheinheimera mangrovi TaxID=2498451 RepID=UPI000F8E023A|nr:hypothetical protein [Rheinheimera mangrovi]